MPVSALNNRGIVLVRAKRYPEGMPETIDPEHYNSLLEVFEKSFNEYMEITAYKITDFG